MLEFHAELKVWKHGYRWQRDLKSYLLPGLTPEKSPAKLGLGRENWRIYHPFRDCPAMFLEFAELGTDREKIRSFADRYGELYYPSEFEWDVEIHREAAEWELAIEQMAGAVALWNAAEAGDKGRVAKLDDLIADRLTCAADVRLYRTGDVLSLRLACECLAHVLWAQLAIAVSDQLQFRRCQTCGQPFKLTDENRIDRQFCSDACRSKSYRRRKATALKMRSEGRRLREIAKEVGTDLNTLKNWLEGETQ